MGINFTLILNDETHLLKAGHHIAWLRGYIHHAIVTDVSGETLDVIHFQKKGGTMTMVKDENITLEQQTGLCFLIRHNSSDRSPEEVVAAAELLLEQQNYNIVTNNCEHSANFCATGCKSSKQSREGVTFVMRQTVVFLKCQTQKYITSCSSEGKECVQKGAEFAKKLSKSIEKQPRVITKASKYCEVAGLVLTVATEIGHCAHDINVYRKASKGGEISKERFKQKTCRRIVKGCCSAAGTVVGSAIGCALGGPVGTSLGNALGTCIGKRVGSWLAKKLV